MVYLKIILHKLQQECEWLGDKLVLDKNPLRTAKKVELSKDFAIAMAEVLGRQCKHFVGIIVIDNLKRADKLIRHFALDASSDRRNT
ncbi:hypothetical protein CCR75_008347 [Bremia lactucae]|uniref:Uncharacterized protein n=1 Tax=Bremia lactucae TaxID=4779 RepID=A0A976FNF0_BRELC|nr:hypothetical protein CCR75_008347 [Bremia lactucae]